MTRKGKIARLPRDLREQLNRRLDDGEPQTNLVEWLNSLPEVQTVLTAEFKGHPITDGNLSEWKAGGFREWQQHQEERELLQEMDADSAELNPASPTRLTDLLAHRLAARYIVAVQASNPVNADGTPDLKPLRELCADIVALRKGAHSAERLNLEHEWLVLEQQKFRHQTVDAIKKAAADPAIQATLYGAGNNDEKTNALGRAIFGEDWDR